MAGRTRRVRGLALAVALAAGATGAAAQTVRLQQLMRAKLGHAEALLEAVVTSDWEELEIRALALDEITREPEWAVLPSPEYAEHSEGFREAVQALVAAARSRDLDAVSMAYVDTTLSCVACHREIALARQAR
jgi:hypothetical protein